MGWGGGKTLKRWLASTVPSFSEYEQCAWDYENCGFLAITGKGNTFKGKYSGGSI